MKIVPLAGDEKSFECDFSSKTLSLGFMEILSIVWCVMLNGKQSYTAFCVIK